MTLADERMKFLRDMLETLRTQTEQDRSQTGITNNRYDRVLNGVEKILLENEDVLRNDIGLEEDPDLPVHVLWALDILGVDTDNWGWAPHKERAERMGW